jgi:uncharacterized membrane protein YgdD (TMEM256/DUF423 family)
MSAAGALVVGALSGALSVLLGAFGAHALEDRLSPRSLELMSTAVQYQAVHALALLAVAILLARGPNRALVASAWAFAVGLVLFPGSLYLLALTAQGWLGAVAPIGGTAFVAGWLLLAWGGSRALTEAPLP